MKTFKQGCEPSTIDGGGKKSMDGVVVEKKKKSLELRKNVFWTFINGGAGMLLVVLVLFLSFHHDMIGKQQQQPQPRRLQEQVVPQQLQQYAPPQQQEMVQQQQGYVSTPQQPQQPPIPPPQQTGPAAVISTETTNVYDMPDGYKRDPAYESDTYIVRSKKRGKSDWDRLKKDWGSWKFTDNRPDFEIDYDKYPARDIPRTQFPIGAWQTDPSYLKPFLQESMDLVTRAMDAILAEYGRSQADLPDMTLEEREEMLISVMFDGKGKGGNFQGGSITQQAKDQLERSFLHAIMTEDQWTFVMSGHSSACGHGNHFKQSYTMQVQMIMEPILARMGVFHQAFNFGMGGLGTIQSSLGAVDLFGDDIDVLMWDSGMTEKDPRAHDTFVRQGILSGKNKVPVIFAGTNIHDYYPEVGTAVTGGWGTGKSGFPDIFSVEEMEKRPWPTRYEYCLCKECLKKECKDNKIKYKTTCWIDRDDLGAPPQTQSAVVGGQASWHPGWRIHQLKGRVITYNLLKALQSALQKWRDSPNYELPDDAWHVSSSNKIIRDKILSKTNTMCHNYTGLSDLICDVPIHARTEFTPRRRAFATSIRSIMKVRKGDEHILRAEANWYDPPDVYVPQIFDIPEGAVDVLAIIENGLPYKPNKARRTFVNSLPETEITSLVTNKKYKMTPGRGWFLDPIGNSDNCDGSFNSFCTRQNSTKCLLSGHNDHRGYYHFDSYSGWLVVELKDMQHGLIFAEIVGYAEDAKTNKNPLTEFWECENNEGCNTQRARRGGELGSQLATTSHGDASIINEEVNEMNDDEKFHRRLAEFCPNFRFEFAIDGEVTSWTIDQMRSKLIDVQRVVKVFVFLDDRNFVQGKKSKTVEFAMRVTGCNQKPVLALSHIYWA